MTILSRTEKAMYGVKLLGRRNTEELMNMLPIEKYLDRTAKASSIQYSCWYSNALRKDQNEIVKTLEFEMKGSRGKQRPKRTWKKQVEDACDRTKWRGVVKSMAVQNPVNSVNGKNAKSK